MQEGERGLFKNYDFPLHPPPLSSIIRACFSGKILMGMFYKFFLVLRAIFFYLIMAITILIGVSLVFVTWPLKFSQGRFLVIKTWSKLMLYTAKYVCGLDFEIRGLENLSNPPFIILSKHQSAWETIVFSGIFPPNCFVTKRELIFIPIFGWAFGISKHIPINRKQGREAIRKISEMGSQRLKEGISIILFPEGTRVKPYENPEFHKGGALLVKATGSKIICVAHNAGHCWRRQSFLKTPGKITVIISAPMETAGLSMSEINKLAHDWIELNMKEIEKNKE